MAVAAQFIGSKVGRRVGSESKTHTSFMSVESSYRMRGPEARDEGESGGGIGMVRRERDGSESREQVHDTHLLHERWWQTNPRRRRGRLCVRKEGERGSRGEERWSEAPLERVNE